MLHKIAKRKFNWPKAAKSNTRKFMKQNYIYLKKFLPLLLIYTANVYRELQGLYGEIRLWGFQIYGDYMYSCNPCNFEISTL